MDTEPTSAVLTEPGKKNVSKPTQPAKDTTEVNVDRDAAMLKGVLDAANAANLGKQMLQVGMPIAEGMADVRLGDAGRNVKSIEVVAPDDPRHELLTYLSARTMITTAAAL